MKNEQRKNQVTRPLGKSLPQFIDSFAASRTLQYGWELLTDDLKQFGFDRILYGFKLYPDRSGMQNTTDSLAFSTYGPTFDELFIYQRGYALNEMALWALTHSGARSWSVSRRRYLDGDMKPDEQALYEATYNLGVKAGYTFANPTDREISRSIFGLCFEAGYEQDHVDRAWVTHETEIVARLKIFEIGVITYLHNGPSEELTPKELEILKHAAEGRTVADISELLGVHRRTVDNQMTKAREKLGVGTTLQAVLKASRQGQL